MQKKLQEIYFVQISQSTKDTGTRKRNSYYKICKKNQKVKSDKFWRKPWKKFYVHEVLY